VGAGTQRMSDRLGEMGNVLTVCDREADIYEYITYLANHGSASFFVPAKIGTC